jgi:2-dehydropantoate 2-reductase
LSGRALSAATSAVACYKRDATLSFLFGLAAPSCWRKNGLTIRSRLGDFHRSLPLIALSDDLARPFDLVLLSCKAYDLDAVMDSFARAVGKGTAILPLLNGMRHLDALAAGQISFSAGNA